MNLLDKTLDAQSDVPGNCATTDMALALLH